MAGKPKRTADRAILAFLTPQAAAAIWADISDGRPLHQVAERAGVSRFTLAEWLDSPDREQLYKRARAKSATVLAESTIQIADNGAAESAPDPARDKLRIQARQWLAARWDRHQYGDRQDTGVTINVQSLHLDALRRRPAADAPLHIDAEVAASNPLTIEAVAIPVSD